MTEYEIIEALNDSDDDPELIPLELNQRANEHVGSESSSSDEEQVAHPQITPVASSVHSDISISSNSSYQPRGGARSRIRG